MEFDRDRPLTAAFADWRLVAVATGVVVAVGAGVVRWRSVRVPMAVAVVVAPERGPAPPKPVPGAGGKKREAEATVPASAVPPAERFDLSQLGTPTEAARRLMQGVWDWRGLTGPMTSAEAVAWKENWDRLVQGGDASVPALAEYLRGDQDTFFSLEDSRQLGIRSAREAAIEALAKIGGPAAVAVMNEAIGVTGSPREVALLARSLEVTAPGQYREQAMAAVRESLEMAAEKQLGGLDVAPLFEVLQTYGGAEVAVDLERASARWGQYATLALAALPDGAGVPSLIHLADPPPDSRTAAARMQAMQVVAQLAATNNDVRAALLEQAREGRIARHHWPYLAQPLAGEQARLQNAVIDPRAPVTDETRTSTVHIAGTNQNLVWSRPPDGLSPDQASRQANLIKDLRAVTRDPDGRRVLDQAHALLEQQRAPAAEGVTPD